MTVGGEKERGAKESVKGKEEYGYSFKEGRAKHLWVVYGVELERPTDLRGH